MARDILGDSESATDLVEPEYVDQVFWVWGMYLNTLGVIRSDIPRLSLDNVALNAVFLDQTVI